MQNIFVEFLPPWIETGIQPAFYDKESGTVLQQTARMYARVNMLIRMFNKLSKNTKEEVERFEKEVNDTVAEYIEKFNELYNYVHDYFDNLDVQEEINNKLDDMVEQGTLQEIITAYIQANVAWTFDTVADMKLATNLIDGSYAQTMGYHSINDGGKSLYKIRAKTVDDVIDEGELISLNDATLVAELVPNRQVVPEQFGAYGDGIHDDILPCRACHDYARSAKIEMGGVRKSTYGVSDTLTLLLNGYDFNNATFKALDTMSEVILFHPYRGADEKVPNEYLKNIIIDADNKADYGLRQDQGGAITYVNNVSILNPKLIGYYQSYGSCRMVGLKVEQMDLSQHCVGFQTDGWDSELQYITCKNCSTGILVNAQGCTFKSCHPSMFDAPDLLAGSKGFHLKQQASLIDCVADTYQYGIYLETQNGFSAVNFHTLIEPLYYNTTNVPNATPYFLYTTDTSVGRTNGIAMFGCWMPESATLYNNAPMSFTNFTTWKGASVRLNNPRLNLTTFNSTLPSELFQNQTKIDISAYRVAGVTADNNNIKINGNVSVFYCSNLVLPSIVANTDTNLFESLPEMLRPSENVWCTVTTMGGVVARMQFRSNGNILIKPQSAITSGDSLWVTQFWIK